MNRCGSFPNKCFEQQPSSAHSVDTYEAKTEKVFLHLARLTPINRKTYHCLTFVFYGMYNTHYMKNHASKAFQGVYMSIYT